MLVMLLLQKQSQGGYCVANNGLINQKSEDYAVNSRLNERLDVIRQMKPNGGLLPGDAPITPAERAEAKQYNYDNPVIPPAATEPPQQWWYQPDVPEPEIAPDTTDTTKKYPRGIPA